MPLKTAADMTRPPWPRTGDGAAAIACRAETRARMFDQCPLDLSGSARSPPGSQGRQGRLHRSPPAGTCCQPLRQMVSRMRWMRSASILPSLQKRRRSSSRLRARSDFPCACTPISSPILGARHWARASARSRPIISDTRTTRGVAAMAPCRHYRCALAGGFLFHSRAATSASRCVPFSRRADRARD
jgi:hypothetical protein